MSEIKQFFFCNSFIHETSRPVAAPMSLKFALKQQVAPNHLACRYNCLLTACMSVRVASHQQICLNQLQLTSKRICSCGG